jgi:diguanylate cyclase (GGDEF)-like protein
MDALTKLGSRGEFDTSLKDAVSSASSQTPLGLLFVDIDHFKKINDGHGHQVGDKVLTAVSDTVQRVALGKGAAFRYGGEEIVVLLPNHTLQESLAVGERMRRGIEATQTGGPAVTASIGVSAYPEPSSSADLLLQHADKAMYSAKNLGRNLARFHGESESAPQSNMKMPDKKSPEGKFSESQVLQMKKSYFQTRRVLCPNDAVPMKVRESNEIGRSTVRLFVHCPLCGLNEVLD